MDDQLGGSKWVARLAAARGLPAHAEAIWPLEPASGSWVVLETHAAECTVVDPNPAVTPC